MAERPRLRPHKVITDGDMSASVTSLATVIPEVSLITYTYIWSGSSPVGTLKVQVSNDYALDATGAVSNAGTWSDVSFLTGTGFAASVAVSGATGSLNISTQLLGAYAVRTVFTFSSGTGTLQSYICGKVA